MGNYNSSILALSDEDKEWCRNPQFGGEPDAIMKRLAAAVIEDAVYDLRLLKKRGVLVNGSVNPEHCGGTKLKVRVADYKYEHQVKELLNFFEPEGCGERWIYQSRLDIDPTVLRRVLTTRDNIKIEEI